MYRSHILVCGGTGCTSSGSQQIIRTLKNELKNHKLQDEVAVVKTGCHGLCEEGPIMVVYPEAIFYSRVRPEDIPEIVSEHLLKGRPVERLIYHDAEVPEGIRSLNETAFYKNQYRVALRNCGVIDPENIDEYIGTGGYEALGKVLTEMTPDEVIQTVLDSGLRGRGGAGFPTGLKWKFASGNRGNVQKYVCCNADEGDPGAFMDRSVLEGDPHVVIEAMTIAGYAIGASQGYIYVRAEYPIAVERLRIAISQAREYGLLGKDIFGSGFDFDLDLRLGAGAFVCGEETALMTSIEGNRGEPRPRPPFPAVKGLFGCPTILNNVETWANIPQIILKGAKWFSSIGTEKSKGTKVFALGGKINNTGLVEIPMGTPLRTVIEDIGGGIPNGKKFKAVPVSYTHLKNKYYLILLLGAFILGMLNLGRATSQTYLFMYVVGNMNMMSVYAIVTGIGGMIGAFSLPFFSNLLKSKGKVICYSSFIGAVLLLIQYLCSNSLNAGFWITGFLSYICFWLALAGTISATGDAAEYALLSTGVRQEGLYGAYWSFMHKAGIAIGSAEVGWMLAATGYTANVQMCIRDRFISLPSVWMNPNYYNEWEKRKQEGDHSRDFKKTEG